MNNTKLQRTVYILLFLFLFFTILHYAKSFLVPLTFAGLLSMLLLPVTSKLEDKGWNRALAVIVSILLLLLFFSGIIALLAWQVSDMAQNSAELEKNVLSKIAQVRAYIARSFGISQEQQQQMIQNQQSFSGQITSNFPKMLGSLGGFLTNFLLVLIYIFLFQYFRTHLKNFVLRLVPQDQKQKTVKTIQDSRKVAQKYMTGLALMIVGLWIMYSIGFSIAGVKNAFFFAILCGLLEIVPFVGNITGTLLTILTSIATGADMSVVIGIVITYSLVQFIQTYILEPLVVGNEVNINPLFTIAGIVAGEFVWGIPGMILAIPVMGVTKIICDNVDALKPYGYLLGEDKKKSTSTIDKLKKWFGKS
jgi:predicted PurR-regulated permease PerM